MSGSWSSWDNGPSVEASSVMRKQAGLNARSQKPDAIPPPLPSLPSMLGDESRSYPAAGDSSGLRSRLQDSAPTPQTDDARQRQVRVSTRSRRPSEILDSFCVIVVL
eukprot:TRINITY_DN16055_c0_g1_i3.p1 TRINITY_DN16055_c0_g1~~TRINITY_DN16055_c0_g1_i3.p1  ORF type:complete len:125 (+),score=0.95 TRINITY_DN16055_c0_g1_i3:55-375(+)